MTKRRESGENEITREARMKATRAGRPIAEILSDMLKDARKAKDKTMEAKVVKAQKYLGVRNKRKRKGGA